LEHRDQEVLEDLLRAFPEEVSEHRDQEALEDLP
jgi:hypothetical protein